VVLPHCVCVCVWVGVFVETSVCGCVISVFWVPRGCILLLSAHSTKLPLPPSNLYRTEPAVALGSCLNRGAEVRFGSVRRRLWAGFMQLDSRWGRWEMAADLHKYPRFWKKIK